jgi:hypothetical protein
LTTEEKLRIVDETLRSGESAQQATGLGGQLAEPDSKVSRTLVYDQQRSLTGFR